MHLAEGVPASRARLLGLLRQAHDVFVTGVSASCGDAGSAVATQSPDLLLLDARLPGGHRLQPALNDGAGAPLVVVLAEDDRDAVAAFEAGALDYLLRPVSERRLAAAVGRARAVVALREDAELGRRLRDVGSPPDVATHPPERLIASNGGRTVAIPVADIDWVEAEGNFVHIHARGDMHVLRSTISALADRLAPAGFVRVHRSRLVNLSRVREVHHRSGGGGTLLMPDGTHLRFSRSSHARLAAQASAADVTPARTLR